MVAVVEVGYAVSVSVEACWTIAGCSGVVTMSFSSVAGVTSIWELSSWTAVVSLSARRYMIESFACVLVWQGVAADGAAFGVPLKQLDVGYEDTVSVSAD